jgi:hypothetical protein
MPVAGILEELVRDIEAEMQRVRGVLSGYHETHR